jgi:hypothetical protein
MGVLLRRLPVLLLPLTLIACEKLVEKSSNPLSPTVAGPIAGVNIDVPGQVFPGGGTKVDDDQQPVSLVVSNPGTNTQRTVVLGVQVAPDAGFANIAFSRDGIALGDGGRTTVQLSRLMPGRTYYWRVKAGDGANDSGWSSPVSFDLMNPVIIGVPTPKSPVGGSRIATSLPVLVVVNGQTSGPTGNIRYQYQVSESAAFTSFVVNGEHIQDPSGESAFALPAVTALDKLLFWRARILGERHTGEWSRIESFRTSLTVVTPPAQPAPPGSGGAASGNWQACSSLADDRPGLVRCVHAALSPVVGVEGAFEVTKCVAWLLRFQGGGLMIKNGGENIVSWRGYSFSAGRMMFSNFDYVKILSDVGGSNGPSWQEAGPGDPSQYVPAIDPSLP